VILRHSAVTTLERGEGSAIEVVVRLCVKDNGNIVQDQLTVSSVEIDCRMDKLWPLWHADTSHDSQ